MNVKGLMETIKQEKLYRFSGFQVGPPNDPNNIGTMAGSGQISGIFEEKPGVWKTYVLERGTSHSSGKEYTESEACDYLLSYLRSRKALIKPLDRLLGYHDYHIKNREKWFD